MHPDIIREVARQRIEEQHEAARQAGFARAMRKAIRAQRNRAETPDTFVAPMIPDYVDGTFRSDASEVPAEHAGTGR
jgi:hypothetical protein